MRFLHEDEGYPVALDQISRTLGVPRAQVEKDYFITHVLWALTSKDAARLTKAVDERIERCASPGWEYRNAGPDQTPTRGKP